MDTSSLVFTPEAAGALDRFSIEKNGVEGKLLMGWAGYSVFLKMSENRWFTEAERVHCFCGSGNNGGDGLVIAWHILHSTDKTIFLYTDKKPAKADPQYYYQIIEKSLKLDPKISKRLFISNNITGSIKPIKKGDLVIDAMFGTGLNRPPAPEVEKLFKEINKNKHSFTVSVDIASGVFGNGDIFEHTAIMADTTYTFGAVKTGQLTYPGIIFSGKLVPLSIGFSIACFSENVQTSMWLRNTPTPPPIRRAAGHKYASGTVEIIGGSTGMEGAAMLAAKSFLRCGGGLAKIYSFSPSITAQLATLPEMMVRHIKNEGELITLTQPAESKQKSKDKTTKVSIIGVGLGETLDEKFWKNHFSHDRITILDGSVLGQIASISSVFQGRKKGSLIMTPHTGEAEKLLGRKLKNHREDAIEIATRFNCHLYLKGPGGVIIIRNKKTIREIYPGSLHSQLATGGTGDTLSGLIANMIIRYNDPGLGLQSAVAIFTKAAETLTNKWNNKSDFLTPSELIEMLRETIDNPGEQV